MIRNKRGEGYVQVCVLVIVICMIMSVFVTFASTVNVVRLMKRNSKTVLESYLMRDSIRIYDSIKQGTNDTEKDSLDSNFYYNSLKEFCTFESHGNYLYHKGDDGVTDYYISTPHLGFTEKGKLRLYVKYTLYVPIYFDRVKVSTAEIPIEVDLDLDERF